MKFWYLYLFSLKGHMWSNNTPNRFTDLKEPAGKRLYKKTYHSVTDITTFKPYFYKFRISLNLFLIRKKKKDTPPLPFLLHFYP